MSGHPALQLGFTIFTTILAMFVVAGTGWQLRRTGILTAGMTSTLSRLITDLVFPALAVSKLITLVSWQNITESLATLGVGAAVLAGGFITGELYARAVLPRASRNTGAFLAAMPNWIFMPLPLVTVLHGDHGIRALLLINVAMQFLLWTAGIWMLTRSGKDAHPLVQLRSNRGLQATALAFLLGLVLPPAASLPDTPAMHITLQLGRSLLDGIGMLGSLTVPLNLLVIGAQLAGVGAERTETGLLIKSVAGRLLIVPIFTVALLTLLRHYNFGGEPMIYDVALIIALMPCAAACAAFTERFGGDIALSARTILASSLASILTVPLLVTLVQQLWRR